MIIRLNKFLSMCGVASRRKADGLIRAGLVAVNGEKVSELGRAIDTDRDRVEVGGRAIDIEKKRYIAFNKPRLCLTALGSDPRGRDTIEKYTADIPERVFPVGRLDYDTEGLLLLTNDGELAHRVNHPRFRIEKRYRAIVRGRVEERHVERMKKGGNLRDGPAAPDSLGVIRHEGEETHIAISFHEGRKHVVKRFLAHFGFRVLRLQRTHIGPVGLGNLPRGGWREITERERKALRRAAGLRGAE